jgi:hypothetical protein
MAAVEPKNRAGRRDFSLKISCISSSDNHHKKRNKYLPGKAKKKNGLIRVVKKYGSK